MATIKHRFVEIHQAHTVVGSDKIWSTITSSELSVIAVSSVCQKIIAAVQSGAFEFSDTLLHLQNLVLTCPDRLKASVFLRTVTALLQCHAQQKQFHDAIELALTTTTTATASSLVHPYIIICRQRPDLSDDVFFEVDFLLSQYDDSSYDNSLLDTMGTFFDSILLTTAENNNDLRKTLLVRFANAYPSTALRTELYYYLADVIERYPTRRAMSFYLQLVDFIAAVFTSPEIPEDELQSIATTLFYQLLCRAYDAATYGYPTLPYLQRLARIYETRDICSDQPLTTPNFYVMWSGLSYLLITAQTINDQDTILILMQHTIHRHQAQQQKFDNAFLVAVLPLFQTWTEIADNDSGAKQRKSLTLQILSQVTEHASVEIEEKPKIKDNIMQILQVQRMTGVMAHMIPYLLNFIDGQLDGNAIPTNSVSHIHSLIFTAPYVFSNNAKARHSNLDRLAQLSSIATGSYSFKFPSFLLVLYLMKSKDIMTSETFLHIYHTVIPSLVDANDPIATTKILQTVLPLIHGQHTSQAHDTTMAAIGLKALVKIYERQPRVWHEVKKALANWILHRKSTRRPDEKLAIQMELAVLTSMRDLCKSHPRTCAQDILPMVVSLLQTCTNLNVASLALIVDIMCTCISAGLAESRSMWNVAVSFIASFSMERAQDQMAILWIKLCDFFAIVGDGNEVSESYNEFKDDVLFNYIEPLMSSDIDGIRSSALSALSHFPADDIMRLLPEKAKQFTDEVIAEPDEAHAKVLTKLLSHELDHMRRNLFKEDAPSNKSKPVDEEAQGQNTAGRPPIGEKEAELTGRFVKAWEQAGTAPGVRAGYTIAVLHATSSHMNDTSSSAGNSITKTKWYRCMTTSIGDIGLTDHLLVRVSCLSGWVSLFETAFGLDDSTFEIKGTQILRDLLGRLEKSTVPGTTCNILMALTGFVLTAHRLSPSFGVSCATQMIDLLLTKYIVSTDQQQGSRSTLVMSEEVQFAANFCLGHIAGCAISNEKLATQMLNLMLDNATAENGTGRRIDTTVDLAQFARGYAAAVYTAALATWPTKTHGIDSLAKNGLETLLQYISAANQRVSESRALGIMMGWTAKMTRSTDMQEICWLARETLKIYTEQGSPSAQLNRGILLGSCWVAAYSAVDEDGNFDSDTAQALQEAAETASNDSNMAQNYYHFDVALAYLNRARFLQRHETEHFKSFGALLRKELHPIKESDVNAAATSILSLGCLLGVDYLSPSVDRELLAAGARAYSNEARVEVLNTLGYAAGVLGGSLAVGNLKNTRIAAVVCGKVNQAAHTMRDAKTLEEGDGNSASAAAQLLLNASTEPKSYSRLSNNTSFLRAVFDSLMQLIHDASDIRTMEILLLSLCETPGPLPPVNWFPLLTDISSISQHLRILTLNFASQHALTSMSLTEYIISQLAEKQFDPKVQILLASETGLGKVFEMSGLPNRKSRTSEAKRRGMDAVTKKTSISEMRCIELFEAYVKTFKHMDTNVQLEFVSTLSEHLPPISETIADEHKELLVKTLRDIVYFNIAVPLLNGKQVKSPVSKLVQKVIECSVIDNSQISEQELTTETAYAQCAAVTELCRLRRTTAPVQLITTTVRQLLLKSIHDKAAWDQLGKAILQVDCDSTKQKLAWVTRILDTLIVIGSGKEPEENKAEVLLKGLADGLRHVLSLFWWLSDSGASIDRTRNEPDAAVLPDTGYMFAHIMYLSNGYSQEQQQMVKRILKLISLSGTWGSDKRSEEFFIQVIRDSPEKAISAQNHDEIARIVTCE
ncbi:hypothetical protein BDB00DRAFT_102267 [Zychaea mexicana]|uniref:uncharacterized protein n=1 Tax=Zychaea mexicana TaxID=64656 RepID=UPI0022FE1908|nr:uncharacterized protein BDB00DRAFT_102267 [Zychaea mexicana]KAI9496661.1 hypothetical protein BDB00DRAFT_102267 [Zychaea mexicana]